MSGTITQAQVQNQMPVSPVTPPRYSALVNSQFNNKASIYVDLGTRLTSQISTARWKQRRLQSAIQEFKLRNPTLTKWSDLKLCESQSITLDKIVIDVTMQRLLDIEHLCKIIEEFDDILVMPISVYREGGRIPCWDGQHTGIALYAIATMVMGLDPSQCSVPMTTYRSTLKSKMRTNFITLNGSGKKTLDPIDLFQQMVFGVRIDGSTDPEWQLNEKKQTILETYHMFATHQKFGDTGQPGALSRVNELLSKNYPIEVTERFARWFCSVNGSSRPVSPKEPVLMYDFFEAARRSSNVILDDDYVDRVAAAMQLMSGDFDVDAFTHVACECYKKLYESMHGHRQGWHFHVNMRHLSLAFLIAQIAKRDPGLAMPMSPMPNWAIDKKDLF
jgi:hypothetical protein